jgi:hypothetical protein
MVLTGSASVRWVCLHTERAMRLGIQPRSPNIDWRVAHECCFGSKGTPHWRLGRSAVDQLKQIVGDMPGVAISAPGRYNDVPETVGADFAGPLICATK